MKRALALLLVSMFVPSIAAADPLPVPHVTPISPVPSTVPTFRGPPPVLLCTNPAATSIDFSIAARTSRYAGRAHIVGTVKNLGNAPYLSSPDQQLVVLYEIPIGGRPRLVAQRHFQNLAPGEAVTVSFDRDWNAASPAEGEFPPNYRLIVSYDPDIRLDGNPRNDDCVSSDNSLERSSGPLNALFVR